MKLHADISLVCFMNAPSEAICELYRMLREAYIANTRKIQVKPQVILTSCATASFKFTYKAMSDVEGLPSHTHMHTSIYVDGTFILQ